MSEHNPETESEKLSGYADGWHQLLGDAKCSKPDLRLYGGFEHKFWVYIKDGQICASQGWHDTFDPNKNSEDIAYHRSGQALFEAEWGIPLKKLLGMPKSDAKSITVDDNLNKLPLSDGWHRLPGGSRKSTITGVMEHFLAYIERGRPIGVISSSLQVPLLDPKRYTRDHLTKVGQDYLKASEAAWKVSVFDLFNSNMETAKAKLSLPDGWHRIPGDLDGRREFNKIKYYFWAGVKDGLVVDAVGCVDRGYPTAMINQMCPNLTYYEAYWNEKAFDLLNNDKINLPDGWHILPAGPRNSVRTGRSANFLVYLINGAAFGLVSRDENQGGLEPKDGDKLFGKSLMPDWYAYMKESEASWGCSVSDIFRTHIARFKQQIFLEPVEPKPKIELIKPTELIPASESEVVGLGKTAGAAFGMLMGLAMVRHIVSGSKTKPKDVRVIIETAEEVAK